MVSHPATRLILLTFLLFKYHSMLIFYLYNYLCCCYNHITTSIPWEPHFHRNSKIFSVSKKKKKKNATVSGFVIMLLPKYAV